MFFGLQFLTHHLLLRSSYYWLADLIDIYSLANKQPGSFDEVSRSSAAAVGTGLKTAAAGGLD